MAVLLFIVILLLLVVLDDKLGQKIYRSIRVRREYPMRKSNLQFFTDGRQLFDDYFQTIKQAKHHIHILFYIVKTDQVSQQFYDLLKQKAKEGVEVRLLVDWIGSFGLPKTVIRSLQESGVKLAYSHRPTFPRFFYKLNRRNHRKITVIDGKTGYIGGFNIGKEYIGQDPKFGDWRDYHLKVTGEGVQDLQTQFFDDWAAATKEKLFSKNDYFPELESGTIPHKFIATNGHFLENDYIHLIEQTKKELIIGSPYFIPSKKVMKALLDALRRGVKVIILVPLKADHPLVKEAAFPYFYRLLKAGAHIYRFYQGFYHAKVIIIDDGLCDIGTANFDKRSFFLNSEINCYIHDKQFVKIARTAVNRDLADAEKLTLDFWRKRTLWDRGKESVSMFISRLL
ncbi:cardiolipin synthase [Anoxybacillus vitaminiphilus]|uniref:Cardiolipin synthase n=1 Tax=Paranoxybacillus vitaminiphilus TaxID=581036 RepID=A0A327YJD2_9BACL|nr:cardiolipin synthase [Anoxybacillus vitaminiphilus]RAK20482.1 cardiolipin synthase [Anoxybacillus vitaminiphilus]